MFNLNLSLMKKTITKNSSARLQFTRSLLIVGVLATLAFGLKKDEVLSLKITLVLSVIYLIVSTYVIYTGYIKTKKEDAKWKDIIDLDFILILFTSAIILIIVFYILTHFLF